MFTAIARILGLNSTPKRPPSKRAVAPKGGRPTPRRTRSDDDASGAPAAPAPRPTDPRVEEVRRQAMAILAAEDPNTKWITALRTITRAADPQQMKPKAEALLTARAIVGQEVSEYARALTVLGRRLPVFDDKLASSRASTAAIRADLEGRAATDFEAWEDARAALSREQAQARRLGIEPPADLALTARVAQGVDDLLIARAARLARRGARTGGAQGESSVGHAGTTTVPTTPTGTATGDADEVETYTPPAGPK